MLGKDGFCSSCHAIRRGEHRLLRVPYARCGRSGPRPGHESGPPPVSGLGRRRRGRGRSDDSGAGLQADRARAGTLAAGGRLQAAALGAADRHHEVRGLRRLRHRLPRGERRRRPRPPRDRRAVDPQGEPARQAHRLRADAAAHVPALRAPAVRGRVPDRRLVQARRRHRAGRQAHLHRLPLLRHGLPVRRALLRPRGGERPEGGRAARQGHGRSPARCACTAWIAARRPACVEACNKDGGKAMVFGDLNDRGSGDPPAPAQRALDARSAPISRSTPACATRACSRWRSVHYREIDGRSGGYLCAARACSAP